MILSLVPVDVPHGVYDIDGNGTKTEMPRRACFLAPDAAQSWLDIQDQVVVSDMWRSPDSSLAAVQAGRGAAAPGFSGHNYGLSIDIDVQRTMRLVGVGIKAELDAWMNAHGWWCWREDHALPAWRPRPNEAWHYNYFGTTTRPVYRNGNCVGWLNAQIAIRYPVWQNRGAARARDLQTDLRTLGLYSGAIDGVEGPLTRAAMRRFEAAWGHVEASRTLRTLAFVAAAKRHADATRTLLDSPNGSGR